MFQTAWKLARGLSDLATTNVCKVDSMYWDIIVKYRLMKMTHYQVLREETSINLTNISEQVYCLGPFHLHKCIFLHCVVCSSICLAKSWFSCVIIVIKLACRYNSIVYNKSKCLIHVSTKIKSCNIKCVYTTVEPCYKEVGYNKTLL